LHFLYAFSSTMIHGVGRDASRVVDAIAERMAESVGTADGYGLQAAGLMPFRPEPGGRASR
jgi:hypothetical protein